MLLSVLVKAAHTVTAGLCGLDLFLSPERNPEQSRAGGYE
jgi:hypothetical protein